ncbi:MAG: 5'-3' exonuclease H3TH domain-containing protein, partial [bacterium]
MQKEQKEEKKTLFLLDGHSITHRAFYALPLLTNDEGEYTNAVFGFMRMFFSLIDEWEPDRMIVTFDKKAPTFRHKEYEEYKANRKKMPEELVPQIPMLQKTLEKLKIPLAAQEGYEADDLLGTLSKQAAEDDYKVFIVTGDKDALQLVSENVNVMYTRKGLSDLVLYNLDKVKDRYELPPEKLIDMKGLMGDSSDNIPGVPGIGEKTAIKLLKQFDSIEEILNNVDKVSGKKRKENLKKYAEQARMSYRLGRIERDVPIQIDFDKCKLDLYNDEKVVKHFKKLGFTTLIDRFNYENDMNPDNIEFIDISTEELVDIKEKALNKGKIAISLKIDKDSSARNGKIFEIVLALDKNTAYIYNIDNYKINSEFKKILEDDKIKKFFIDAKEASLALLCKNVEVKNIVFDPLLASYL